MANNNKKSDAEIYREQRKARLAKSAKKNAKKSKKIHLSKTAQAVISVIVVLAICVSIGTYAYSKSSYKASKVMALEVNGETVPACEYSYYYNTAFLNVFNYSYYYDNNYGAGYGVQFTGYDYTVTPDQQAYNQELEGYDNPTFLDYFDYSAKEAIKRSRTYANLAEEQGLELDEDDYAHIEENMASIEESASKSQTSANAYLKNMYGNGVGKTLVRQMLEREALATKYEEAKKQEYKDAFTDDEIEKQYNADKASYDVVSIRYYTVNAEKESVASTDSDGNPTTADQVTDATMLVAKNKAEQFAAAVKDDESFKATASNYAKLEKATDYEDYLTDDTKTLYDASTSEELSNTLSSEALTWAFDSARKTGATRVEEKSGTGYTVYMISSPADRNTEDYNTYDVRHILIEFPEEETTTASTTEAEVTTAESAADDETTTQAAGEETATTAADETKAEVTTTEATTEETTTKVDVTTLDVSKYSDVTIDLNVDADTAKDAATYKKAQDILEKYLKGDKTADSFGALAKENTADSNGDQGGIYENVEIGQMVPEFEGWCLEEGRKPGDVGMVESDYGYHIMYFVGLNENGITWKYNVLNDLADEKFADYSEELLAKEEYTVSVTNDTALTGVAENTIKSAKAWIAQAQSQSSATY